MLVIVRTARRDDAKNAAQLLASMTRGDRVRGNALFDAISAREPTHGAQSDFDQGAIALNALHASITEHGVDENARERASTAIRQVGMGPVSSESARDSLMWCLRRLIEQDSANTRPGAGLVLQGLEAGLAELVKRTGDRMLVGEHARTMRIYALRHLARRDPEQAVEYWMSTIEQLMLVTGPGREAVKYATLSREPVTFEAREALWFLQALTKLKTIPEGADTKALNGLEERLRTRMGGLAKDERMRVADQIKQRIEELRAVLEELLEETKS